jgi:hypothetical protein
MMRKLFFLGFAFMSTLAFSQTSGKNNPSIYDQLDKNQPTAKTYSPIITPVPPVINYDREIARLQVMLDEENAKPNPDAGHVFKLTYHIQNYKIERQRNPNKLTNLNSK